MTWLIRLAAMAMLASPLGAQGSAADERELAQYRLTSDVLARAGAVAQTFAANLEKDPATRKRLDAQREIAALDKKDELTEAEEKRLEELSELVADSPDAGKDDGSLASITAQLSKTPAMAAALKSAGMLPRDMARFIVTATQASMVAAVQGAGASVPLPRGLSADNVKFAADHDVEIERIFTLLGVGSR